MMHQLPNEDKLRLLRFLSCFAWADLDIDQGERDLLQRFIERMDLSPEDAAEAAGWLDHPPREDDLDPSSIPDDQRKLFLDAVLEMVGADGVVDRMEAESFVLFEALMTPQPSPSSPADVGRS